MDGRYDFPRKSQSNDVGTETSLSSRVGKIWLSVMSIPNHVLQFQSMSNRKIKKSIPLIFTLYMNCWPIPYDELAFNTMYNITD